jgi:cytochrome c556
MKLRPILPVIATFATASFVFGADDDNPIKKAMVFAHKAPKGEKKLNEKIVEGTADEADIKKALELYKAMADTKPPKGEPAAFKEKTNKLVAATEEVLAKKPEGVEHYKAAVDCKACHSDFRKMPPGGPGGPGGPGPGGPGGPPPPP